MKTLIMIGTRPEAIKLAPVVFACRAKRAEIETTVCATGQHREMLKQTCDYFQIEPDLDLDLMEPNQSLERLTSKCLTATCEVIDRESPDCVVAQGDTTTVLASAIASFYKRIPFVHVEAGLRSGRLHEPWPEEFNRRVASIATTIHCAPTQRAATQLIEEGFDHASIFVTGNTVIDALLWATRRERDRGDHWERKHPYLQGRRFVLITGHRRENFGPGFSNICEAVRDLSQRFPAVSFVYPMHLNPNVQKPVREMLSDRENVHLSPPVAYPEFVWLMDNCHLILTDSGGVQEEAPSLRKPVLVMRETTERPEAVHSGAARLVGTDREKIVREVALLVEDTDEYQSRQIDRNPYGDGNAAERIADLILSKITTIRDA